MTKKPRIRPVGDSALTVEFGTEIDETVNAAVHALAEALERQPVCGMTETVPTYRSLMITYDPSRISYARLCRAIRARLRAPDGGEREPARTLLVPCLYEGEDIGNVADHAGLTAEQVIAIHSAIDYRIYMLGFLPGFVYLGGLDERIHTPRLASPRKAIPAGAVGIGGSQTGIYPMVSPGGWQLIGQTPIVMYDPKREPPVLCRAGDRIRFVPCTRETYDRIAEEVRQGTWQPEWAGGEGE